jgi:hypothetical protein
MSTEDEKKSVGLSKEQFEVITNKIAVAVAKHEAVVQGWIAKSARANERRKTQEELEAEDAALFRPQPPRLGLGCPVPSQFLKNDAESSTKELRAKFFPSKTLKASKARDAEEKAASAKRGLKDQSSDEEEEGRSSLGRAKKLKTKPQQESVKRETRKAKHEPAIEESTVTPLNDTKDEGLKIKPNPTAAYPQDTNPSDSLEQVDEIEGDGGFHEEKSPAKSKRNKKQRKRDRLAAANVDEEKPDLPSLTRRPKPSEVSSPVDNLAPAVDTNMGDPLLGNSADEVETLKRKELEKLEKKARKKERKEMRRMERGTAGVS